MKLVIKVNKSDLRELKDWIEINFGRIKTEIKGFQDFSKIDSNGSSTSASAGALPYAGNNHEVIAMESVTDSNMLVLCFSLPSDVARLDTKSLHMIAALLNHKGKGGLF